MAVLKTLVIVFILFGVGIDCEEITRKGKCGGGSNQKMKGMLRKPYPLQHHEHKFNVKKESESKVNRAQASSLSQENKKPEVFEPKHEEYFDFDVRMLEKLVADPVEIPSRIGTSSRLSISADGEVKFARSMTFHDDNGNVGHSSHEQEHMDEDHDQFHKIRTVRSSSGKGSGPQQLSSQLDKLQEANTLQNVDVSNSANAGEYLQVSASGEQISVTNQGSSSATGTGTIYSSGSTTVNTSANNGWKEQEKK